MAAPAAGSLVLHTATHIADVFYVETGAARIRIAKAFKEFSKTKVKLKNLENFAVPFPDKYVVVV